MKKIVYIMVLAFIAGGLREFLVLITGTYQNVTITLINIVGSFALAFLIPLLPNLHISDVWISGVSFGFIGSFTTFSTFTMQSVLLLKINYWWALLFFLGNLIGGIIAGFLGQKLSDMILTRDDNEVNL